LKNQRTAEDAVPFHSSPLRERYQTPEREPSPINLIPPSVKRAEHVLPAAAPTSSVSAHDSMAHLSPQVEADVVLDFDHPEKNKGIWAFRNERVGYCGERITFCNFILIVSDPRECVHVSVTLLEDLSGFKLRQSVVPDSFTGKDEQTIYLNDKLLRQPEKMMQVDSCTEDEAENVISACISSYLVWLNKMKKKNLSRFLERTYYFPDGEKARPNLFGNSNENVRVLFSVNPFHWGKKAKQSYAASAEWCIALDLEVEELKQDITPPTLDKMDELENAAEG
jgi:hypothetical protein